MKQMKSYLMLMAALIASILAGPVLAEPTTRPSDAEAFSMTPGELIARMQERRAEQQAIPVVAQIDLSQPMLEKPAGFSLFGGGGLDLRGVIGRLQQAREDESVHAVLLTFYSGGLMNFAQAQEIRDELAELRKAGKRTFVYADTYDTVGYLVATAATDVVLMDGGELFMPGVAVEPMFYKGTLDMLGVTPDYIQIGEYKGADEAYTRKQPSPELAQEMEQLVTGIYDQIVRQVSAGRSLSKAEVEKAIDRAMTPARQAMRAGFVDHLADADGLRQVITDELGVEEVRVAAGYGMREDTGFDPDNPFAFFELLKPKSVDATKPSVALVYATGVITGGEGGTGGLLGSAGVGSEYIRRAMRLAERDDEIKAVVIRIDSPGGSALASEAMYQAVRRVAEKKPVVISIGGMAASGGYYLAVAGDTIYADPAAIVGSIGVVGGKLVLDGLYDMVGLSTATFAKGKNADLFSTTDPWTEQQQRLVRRWMKSTYDQFTDRVMSTRGGKIEDVDTVARGRIFLADHAKRLGMVDELGGLDDALADAARQGGLGEDFDVVLLPDETPDPFAGGGLPLPIGQAPIMDLLGLFPAHARQAVLHAVATSELLADRPVVAITPITIRIR